MLRRDKPCLKTKELEKIMFSFVFACLFAGDPYPTMLWDRQEGTHPYPPLAISIRKYRVGRRNLGKDWSRRRAVVDDWNAGCQVPPFSSFFRISSFFPPFWAKCPPCPPFSCLLGLRSLKCTFCGNFRALILYFSKKVSSLASLGMNLILSHSFGICSVFYIFHLACILLHYIHSSHNLSCL